MTITRTALMAMVIALAALSGCGGGDLENATGSNGTTGANGSQDSDGQNGSNGAGGLTSLVSVLPEPAGTNCPNGGTRVESGLDLDTNGTLDPAEVTSISYVCTVSPVAVPTEAEFLAALRANDLVAAQDMADRQPSAETAGLWQGLILFRKGEVVAAEVLFDPVLASTADYMLPKLVGDAYFDASLAPMVLPPGMDGIHLKTKGMEYLHRAANIYFQAHPFTQTTAFRPPLKGPFVVAQGPMSGRAFHGSFAGFYSYDLFYAGAAQDQSLGRPFYAAADGVVTTVVQSHPDNPLGTPLDPSLMDKANMVVVEHAGGLVSVYAHMQQYSAKVAPGDPVSAGQELGAIGNSGYSTGPHVHFYVVRQGDPLNLLAQFTSLYSVDQAGTVTSTSDMSISGVLFLEQDPGPQPNIAASYLFDGGSFLQGSGGVWNELDGNGALKFSFSEVRRDSKLLVLFDGNRNVFVRFPIVGGPAQYALGAEQGWVTFATVVPGSGTAVPTTPTAPAPDTTAPQVTSTSPVDNATGVAVNSAVTVNFSEPVDAASVNTLAFTLTGPGGAVQGSVVVSGTMATFLPTTALDYDSNYTALVTTGARDLSGNALAADYGWSFRTVPVPDTVPPQVSGTSPVNNATGVAVNSAVTVSFSEEMDASTINSSSLIVRDANNSVVAGLVSYAGGAATFVPSTAFDYDTAYTLTVVSGQSGAKDLAGNGIAADFTSSFTTATASATSLPPGTVIPLVCPDQPNSPICFSAVDDGTRIRFSLQPNLHAEFTAELYFPVLDGLLEEWNLKPVVLQPGVKTEVAVVVRTGGPSWYEARVRGHWGDYTVAEDPYLYALPWTPGETHNCGNAWNGVGAHQGNLRYGVDFDMPEGTPVTAARDGVVIYVDSSQSVGGTDPSLLANFVYIRHDNGVFSRYAHFKQGGVIVQVGQVVRRGEVIGYSGNTGWSTGPHLHFDVMTAMWDGTAWTGVTLPVKFQVSPSDTTGFVPTAGVSYTAY